MRSTIDNDSPKLLAPGIGQRIAEIAERVKSRGWYTLDDACQDIWLAFLESPTFTLPDTVSGFVRLAWRQRYEVMRREKFRAKPLRATHQHLLIDEERIERARRLVDDMAEHLSDFQLTTCLAVIATEDLKSAAEILGVTPRAVQICLSRIRDEF